MSGDSADQGDGASRDSLLEEFRRIADEVGHIPRPYEFDDTGRYSGDDFIAEFGSWTNVIEAAGLQPQRADIIVEARRINRELGRTPTAGQFGEHSYLDRDDYKRYFDSWRDVLSAAEVFASEDEVRQAIRDLEQELGHVPNTSEFADATRYRRVDYLHHFDSWGNALIEAGLASGKKEVTTTISQLREELGRTPTQAEFEERAESNSSTSLTVFQTWTAALEAAEAFPDREKITDSIRQVNRETGRVPLLSDLLRHTDLRTIDYRHHFDSWDEALEAADIVPDDRDIVAEIAELDAELDRDPKIDDLFRADDCFRNFDSWEEALDEAGVLPTEAELVAELRLIKEEYGYEGLLNSSTEGQFPRSYYEYQFGSWNEALSAAEVLPSEQELLDEIGRVIRSESTVPTRQTVLSQTCFRHQDYVRHFNSITLAIKQALRESNSIEDVAYEIISDAHRQRLNNITADLGRPPTEYYARRQTDIDIDALFSRFSDWGLVLEAAGLNPDHADFVRDLALEIETLYEHLGHRPSFEEVREYISGSKNYIRKSQMKEAFKFAELPKERDLTPSHSLTRQKYDQSSGQVPSHTDLLAELNILRSRNKAHNIEEEYDNRSVIEERHYDIQFGDLSEAIEVLESIDTREFREPREHIDSVPGPILSDSVEELADILERPPLLEEVLFFGDASPSDFVRAFESWSQVTETVEQSESWSNEELLTELEYVGRQLGKPPTPTEMTEYSSHPTQCYLRRFGSWPNTLSLVGVDTEHIPEEYLGFRRTARLWDVTDHLIREEFGHRAALLDELYRLAFELGREPTADDIRNYSPYATTTFEREFGSVEDALAILEEPFEYDGSPSTDPTESDLLEELRAVSERSTEWILPQDICLHSRYSPGTFLGIFGSLEAALEGADLPTDHLHGQTATYGDIWHSDHQVKTGLLREIQRITSKDGEPPTMIRISTVDGIDQNVIYRYFDSWDDAREAAGVISSRNRSADINVERETTDNPEFVNGLMSEISEMMDDPE